ncbi:hypothetical protein B9Z55_021345 [Caenorhabditis nigoni]|uniref:F-box domain-containing protein n=1 Tax=Caenorhabditis nigoni TaxID=1611254 RepID=A0A2G5TS73_9PELO|nr:hypothetical protein B9Z55_021345 [Caenorhabditis nigoni]
MAPKLTDMPELVMNQILDELDYKSIQPLRKVCRDIRNFIDDKNPNPKIDIILIECKKNTGDYQILYDNSGFGLHPRTWTSVFYEKYKTGCLVRYKDREIVLENEDFLNRSMEDLEMIIRSKNTTVRLRLDQNPLDCGKREPIKIPKGNEKVDFSLILDTLKKKVLEPRTRKLKVHRLKIETNDQREIMKVLPFLDSEFLKELCIFNTVDDDKNRVLKMDEILKLDHLNNFERFEISGCVIPDSCVTNFAHIPYCHIQVESINSKDLLFLKDVILRFPTFREFEIKFQKFPGLDEFFEANGIWKTDITFSPEKFQKSSYFQMEDSDSIVMITYSTLHRNKISFEKKTLRWVTSGGPIVIQ